MENSEMEEASVALNSWMRDIFYVLPRIAKEMIHGNYGKYGMILAFIWAVNDIIIKGME